MGHRAVYIPRFKGGYIDTVKFIRILAAYEYFYVKIGVGGGGAIFSKNPFLPQPGPSFG
jgi:hypothetical protein